MGITTTVMIIPMHMATVTDMSTVVNDGHAITGSALLGLLHLSSPALPVGAFAYSQGLEYALDREWCNNREQIQTWLQDSLRFGIATLDLPLYLRLYRAWQNKDYQSVQHWNETLLAYRETRELYLEDTQVGSAYAQWHLGQDLERQPMLDQCPQPTVAAMSALASVLHGIPESTALLGFCWSWCENQIACASKALPLGQTDGQKILQQLLPLIEQVCIEALTITDDEIGSSLFGAALASSLHEHQYSRLFRS